MGTPSLGLHTWLNWCTLLWKSSGSVQPSHIKKWVAGLCFFPRLIPIQTEENRNAPLCYWPINISTLPKLKLLPPEICRQLTIYTSIVAILQPNVQQTVKAHLESSNTNITSHLAKPDSASLCTDHCSAAGITAMSLRCTRLLCATCNCNNHPAVE